MATTPTIATVRQSYVTYADYEETGSQASCKAFITACRRLLALLPTASGGAQSTSFEFDVSQIRSELEAAQNWLATNQTSADNAANPDVVHYDFSEFSDR